MIRRLFPPIWIIFLASLCLTSCIDKTKYLPKPYEKPLEIVKISNSQYLHVSYIKTEQGDFIPCNGFIYIDQGEAMVFETPLNDSISEQLINFVEQDLKATIRGIIVHHAHYDAAGGVNAFSKKGIPSYALDKTAGLLKKDSIEISNPFKEKVEIPLGKTTIVSGFYGEAHTKDNIVSYIKEEAVLVGGCMIKALNGNKGNLEDATVAEWSNTVQRIKEAYPEVKRVIPGHGTIGDSTLLDYTIDLFESYRQPDRAVALNLE